MYRNTLVFDQPRQYTAVEYYQLSQEIISKLKFFQPHLQIQPARQFQLSSYYDELTLVATSYHNVVDSLDEVLEIFGAADISKTDNYWQFIWKDFPVKLKLTAPQHFDFSCHYYTFGTIGELINCMAQDINYQLLPCGLWHTNTDLSRNEDSLLTSDFYSALELLGYDSNRYKEGFNSLDEVLSFVTNNRYIHDTKSFNYRYPQIHRVPVKEQQSNLLL